jgi:hypothetical protein
MTEDGHGHRSYRTIAAMTLKQSNPYLKSAAVRKAALRVSAQTSIAVEGIRVPFAKGKRLAKTLRVAVGDEDAQRKR